MEILVYTVVGIALYLICDRLLVLLEQMHGERLPGRNVVFFVLIMVLSLSTFSFLRAMFAPEQGAQNDYQEQQPTDGRNQPAQTH